MLLLMFSSHVSLFRLLLWYWYWYRDIDMAAVILSVWVGAIESDLQNADFSAAAAPAALQLPPSASRKEERDSISSWFFPTRTRSHLCGLPWWSRWWLAARWEGLVLGQLHPHPPWLLLGSEPRPGLSGDCRLARLLREGRRRRREGEREEKEEEDVKMWRLEVKRHNRWDWSKTK